MAYAMQPQQKPWAGVADAVVIGSKIIQLIENIPRDKVAGVAHNFLAEIRVALASDLLTEEADVATFTNERTVRISRN